MQIMNLAYMKLEMYTFTQGHPTTVFCKISVPRSEYRLEFSITWVRLKVSKSPFHSCTIFEAYVINSLRFSEELTAQVRLFFVKKMKPTGGQVI